CSEREPRHPRLRLRCIRHAVSTFAPSKAGRADHERSRHAVADVAAGATGIDVAPRHGWDAMSAPAVYALSHETLGLAARDIPSSPGTLGTSPGCKAFGYQVAWCNRLGAHPGSWACPPTTS